MRLVGALVVMQIPSAIAAGAGVLVAAILATKALHRGPCLDQRAIHRETFCRQQATHGWQVQNAIEEHSGDVAFKQSVPVMAEHRGHPYRLVHRQAKKGAQILSQGLETTGRKPALSLLLDRRPSPTYSICAGLLSVCPGGGASPPGAAAIADDHAAFPVTGSKLVRE